MDITLAIKLLCFLLLSLTLTACGGSSSSDKNAAPTVNAGSDQQVQELALVDLAGSAADESGIASYVWSQISGPQVDLLAPNRIGTFFSAPLVAEETVLSFQLTVTDTLTASSTDTIDITVSPIVDNPIVNAGIDQTVDENSAVTLQASASDTHGIASQTWSQTSGPSINLENTDSLVLSFIAPLLTVDTSYTFKIIATDLRGDSSEDTVTVHVSNINEAPTVNAGPDQTKDELANINLSAQASDDVEIISTQWLQLSGPTINLSNSNSLSTSFTAPLSALATVLRFQFTATDNEGVSSSDIVEITTSPIVDNPVIDAGSNQTVDAASNVTLTASASDMHGIASQSWSQISGPNITLLTTDSLTTSFTAPSLNDSATAVFQLTVTDNRGSISQDQVSITIQPVAATATISGLVKYENVPHTVNSGLDYANSTFDPIRGADVELLDSNSLAATPIVIAATKTNSLGEYSFNNIEAGQSAIVRVKASYVKSPAAGEASWDMQVVDNTNSGAIYALDSSIFTTATEDLTKNLSALSGWNLSDNDYTAPRAAAPFHILDRAYDMVMKIVNADSDVVMPATKLNWSIKNAPANGDKANGLIGTSHYVNGNLYILGLKDSDTDEYDGHVILHELGHYFEDKLSRSDSIGGSHSNGDRLDMRVAFGEGFGNAWSGIISDNSYYRDSSGNQQGVGFYTNVEENNNANAGWYSEGSVQSILYDIYDSTNEAGDATSLGFQPLYDVLIGAQKNTPAFASIFSFIEALKTENPASEAAINTLLTNQSIVSSTIDLYASTEDNNAGNADHVLPVYTLLTTDGVTSAERCSIDTYSTYNKLSVARFFRFTANSTNNYTITAAPSGANSAASDPAMTLYKKGEQIRHQDQQYGGSAEVISGNLAAGDYVIAVSHYDNSRDQANKGTACFTLTITQN